VSDVTSPPDDARTQPVTAVAQDVAAPRLSDFHIGPIPPVRSPARASARLHWRRPFRSLTVRLALGAAFWSVISLVAVGLVLSSLFRGTVERAFDARLDTFLLALVRVSEVGPDGQLRMTTVSLGDPRFDQALSGWYWQIEGPHGVNQPRGPDARSHSLWEGTLPAPMRAAPGEISRTDVDGPDGQSLRVIAIDVTLPGSGLPFVFTVAGDRAEMQVEIDRFEGLLAWSLTGLCIGLILAIVTLVRFGLSPLRRVSQALAAIRSGKADRLRGEFPIEIQPLADELNALVEHNASLLERARRHVGNLAHALKTPISVLTNEAEAPAGPGVEPLKKQLAIMRAQVDHHLARARMAATGGLLVSRTQVAGVIGDLARTLKRIYGERQIEIDVEAPPSLAFRGESEDFEELVGNLMDNACKWARSRVVVTAAREDQVGGARLRLAVEDDGPGISPEAMAQVSKRGIRLDESVPGSGLGLSIVRDLAELYGGTLTLDRSALGGLKAELLLAAAEVAE
jgi:signal transduction histidine kinase